MIEPTVLLTKQCAKCRQQLSVTKFSYDKRTKDGYKYRCNVCINENKGEKQ
jgi:hypothetical protein